MTSVFSWQSSVSLCPASFCTPRPNLPIILGISWLLTFAFQSPTMKRTSFFFLTWIWANSGRQCRTKESGMLQSRGLQRVVYDLVTEQQHQQKNQDDADQTTVRPIPRWLSKPTVLFLHIGPLSIYKSSYSLSVGWGPGDLPLNRTPLSPTPATQLLVSKLKQTFLFTNLTS